MANVKMKTIGTMETMETKKAMNAKKLSVLLIAVCMIGLLAGCGAGNTNAPQTETAKDQSEYPYVQRLEPVEPVDGEVGGAAAMLDLGNVEDSPYFEAINYYDGTDLSDSLILIDHFQTYQQTSERSCGAACVLMVVNYLTGEAPGEDTLDKEMDIRYVDNVRADGSYGASTASVAEALRARGFEVVTSADTQDEDGYSFYSEEEITEFIAEQLQAKKPIVMESVEWGGHWMVLIGYDDMGTPDVTLDDVLVFADPYDTSDHCQDGYYTISFERYFSQWFDHQVMAESERNQQYVAVTK